MNRISEIAKNIDENYKQQLDSLKDQTEQITANILEHYKAKLKDVGNTIEKDTLNQLLNTQKNIKQGIAKLEQESLKKALKTRPMTLIAGVILGILIAVSIGLTVWAAWKTNEVKQLTAETAQLKENLMQIENWKIKDLKIETNPQTGSIYLLMPDNKSETYSRTIDGKKYQILKIK